MFLECPILDANKQGANMNIYEITYTKLEDGILRERKYQIPATSELQAAVELGKMYPDQQEFPYNETVITIISVEKVG